MLLLLWGVALVLLGGAASLLAPARWAPRIAAGSTMIGCGVGLIPVVSILLGGAESSLRWAWSVPGGSFFVGIDALSALFLVPILALSAIAALYAVEYFASGGEGPASRAPWFWGALLTVGMVLAVVARNGVLFLAAWEVMTLASFFLVTSDDGEESVREAGWTYLIAAHAGTACLFALFVLLGRPAGSLDFDRLAVSGASAAPTLLLFGLALTGFGTKAGFVPLHVWLPEAHPAAPSPVSALMSGVMIKTGIYGLLRFLAILGPGPESIGWALVLVGAVTGISGGALMLVQSDVKRLLAYSSVENMGVIALGIGVGSVGLHAGSPGIAFLGFGGALLHVLNHSIFKGLLFLGAGAAARAAGTRDVGRLGGLLRRMPVTSGAFLTGAWAITGLPPLNGFAGEFLIFVAAFTGVTKLDARFALPCLVALTALALIGGLAVAGFARVFGFAFLGSPRSAGAAGAREAGGAMRLSMILLAAASVASGFSAPWMVRRLASAVAVVTLAPLRSVDGPLAAAAGSLQIAVAVSAALVALTGGLWLVRRRLLAGREVASAETWGCGYASPSARMQYTASSFAEPLAGQLAFVIRPRRDVKRPEGPFPASASFASSAPDLFLERLYRPWLERAGVGISRLRFLQQGQVRVYVAYIAATLLVLLLWKLR